MVRPRPLALRSAATGARRARTLAQKMRAFCQTVDAVRTIEAAAGKPLAELRADGGAAANGWLMHFQADVLGVPVVVPEVSETTALGAAALAALGVDLLTLDGVQRSWRERARYEPRMSVDRRASLLADWHAAVERAKGWAREEDG